MTDFTQEIQRLQKLSCIALSPQEEKKLGAQLSNIIGFLGKLPETKTTNQGGILIQEGKLTLRTIAGVKTDINNDKILKNVKHQIVNNSIVIKSVLS
ncbi:MAG TPA: hypothetical protein PKC87_05900 [Candidatus Absconditabacterales bacterium]|nr:hypothetical protein [Candidatus Absconditabacterales bacterium]